ncbi:phosphatidic acid-binding protein [Pseudomonas aeruginosa]|nr:phosphatidic acid-binding protein [Pseudomonas aeruginosa]MBG6923830.1 phosphatidic acid-binding protein [Pseudomonas aeruginosa]MCO3844910.1 SCP2 domain-containing protein [Pseudomonas aeruginosa]
MLNRQRLLLGVAGRLLPLAAKVPRGLQHLVLQRVANRLFAQPLEEGAFDLLEGRWLRLEVRDLGVGWCVTRVPGGLRLVERPRASVTIRGDWRDFLLLASRHEDPDTLFFRRRLVIEGDTELGLAVKNLLDSLDPEHLPPWLWTAVERAGRAVQEERGEAPQGPVQGARGG